MTHYSKVGEPLRNVILEGRGALSSSTHAMLTEASYWFSVEKAVLCNHACEGCKDLLPVAHLLHPKLHQLLDATHVQVRTLTLCVLTIHCPPHLLCDTHHKVRAIVPTGLKQREVFWQLI